MKKEITNMSLRGWVIALLSFIACLLLVNRGLFPEAPGNRAEKLNSGDRVTSTAVADPMRGGSR
jgi:hypothetical protein